jgi:hypothetical protein
VEVEAPLTIHCPKPHGVKIYSREEAEFPSAARLRNSKFNSFGEGASVA